MLKYRESKAKIGEAAQNAAGKCTKNGQNWSKWGKRGCKGAGLKAGSAIRLVDRGLWGRSLAEGALRHFRIRSRGAGL